MTEIGMLVFPGLTQLDLTGPAEVFSRMPGVGIRLIGATLNPVSSRPGPIVITPTHTYDTSPDLDVVFVPGGPGQQDAMADRRLLEFLRRQAQTATYITSVCTGSLVLAAAGLLTGYKATCHWMALDLLAKFGAEPVAQRVVIDRNRVTGAGVAAGVDFALTLAAELIGSDAAKDIQLQIEYDPDPPYHCGSPGAAESDVLARVRKNGAELRRARELACSKAAAELFAGGAADDGGPRDRR
jgi:cyclohexyl-isocyanide hydratase